MPLPNGGRLRRLRRLVLQIAAQAHVPIAQPRITARNGIANQVNARLLRHVRRAATAGAGAAWGATDTTHSPLRDGFVHCAGGPVSGKADVALPPMRTATARTA